MLDINILDIPTPCHIIDLNKLVSNIEILHNLRKNTDLTLLFAIKGFSNDKIIKQFIHYFDGICASSLWEARLGTELLAHQIHTFSPAYSIHNFCEITKHSDFIIFNSISQWNKFKEMALNANCNCGIRINPEYSEAAKFSINPCHYASRFGVHASDLETIDFEKIKGLHFHTMCEQYSDALLKALNIIENDFGQYLYEIDWLNIGGGQFFCDATYNLPEAIFAINQLQNKYSLNIIAEPCETVMLNTGYFVATVTDIVENQLCTAILDASVICHLPDIVNSPYRCDILNASRPYVKKYTYRIAGCTCYAGDIFGDYSFETPLEIGTKIVFQDTAAYSMVKSNIFNGIQLPYYATIKDGTAITVEKKYDYNTFLSLI